MANPIRFVGVFKNCDSKIKIVKTKTKEMSWFGLPLALWTCEAQKKFSPPMERSFQKVIMYPNPPAKKLNIIAQNPAICELPIFLPRILRSKS
jgi:hypothetical protein